MAEKEVKMPEAKDFPLKASAATAARAVRLRQQHQKQHPGTSSSSMSSSSSSSLSSSLSSSFGNAEDHNEMDLSGRCYPRKRSSCSAHSPLAGSDIESDLLFNSLDSVHGNTAAMLNFLSGGTGTVSHGAGGRIYDDDDDHDHDTDDSDFDGHDSFASLGADDDDEEEVYREHRNIMARQMFEASVMVSPVTTRTRPILGGGGIMNSMGSPLLQRKGLQHSLSTRRLTKDQSFHRGLDLIAE